MSIRIEIQEQPERNRFFAEVEAGRVARRKLVMVPMTGDLAADLDAHWAEVKAALMEMLPELQPKRFEGSEQVGDPVEQPAFASMPPAPEPPAVPARPEPPTEPAEPAEPVEPSAADEKDALIERARELGLKPDRRWGVARLEKAIAKAEGKD